MGFFDSPIKQKGKKRLILQMKQAIPRETKSSGGSSVNSIHLKIGKRELENYI